ncbi:MAG: pyrroloquinoline quinone biosynthesis protein PqqE [Alphaproteobacteria bacterium]
MALLAELTHRCPLQCPYCSNPVELARVADELGTDDWRRVLDQAAALGVLQVHFSGGEPTARPDLVELVAHAEAAGLYSNLITSGVLLTDELVAALAEAGLAHVQLSVQGADATTADRVAGHRDGHAKKLAAAARVTAAELPLTLNAVVHRQNLDQLGGLIELAVELGASRLEVAHVQYYGWGLRNRAALMPTLAQIDAATATVEAARDRLKGRLVIDYVIPDYYARRPKACMNGWGRQFLNVSPTGQVLPCHAAESIAGLDFDSVRDHDLAWIWQHSDAFERFRGTAWMPEPCQSCDRAEIDWGGCRCQAFALAGDASLTDPACEKSPLHGQIFETAKAEANAPAPDFTYRNYKNA